MKYNLLETEPIHKQERQTARQTDRHKPTGRQAGKQASGQAGKQTDRQTILKQKVSPHRGPLPGKGPRGDLLFADCVCVCLNLCVLCLVVCLCGCLSVWLSVCQSSPTNPQAQINASHKQMFCRHRGVMHSLIVVCVSLPCCMCCCSVCCYGSNGLPSARTFFPCLRCGRVSSMGAPHLIFTHATTKHIIRAQHSPPTIHM